MNSCIVLLSGGLDSTVATAMMRGSMRVALALTFDYGQRAVAREIATAQNLCAQWDIPHQVISFQWLGAVSPSALTDTQKNLPQLQSTQLDDIGATTQSAAAVWVPNRNGMFLNSAAAIAEARQIPWIVAGFNREEASTFPDNSTSYVEAANRALFYSTNGKVSVVSPTQAMTKKEIVSWAQNHQVPLDQIWPCYEGGAAWCRKCESCLRFLRAIGD
jgi:7-cyano-7-deazaguanine synthase